MSSEGYTPYLIAAAGAIPLMYLFRYMGMSINYSICLYRQLGQFILFRSICRYMAQGPKYSKPNRIDGKVVIVTGANAGMGKEVALELARRGGKVYLACRDSAKGEEVCQQIIDKTGNPNVFCRVLDLSSFESIRSFVKEYVFH